MAQSAETENVHVAARFGWNLAMLRGRLRDGPPAEAPVAIHRTDHALPLGVERSWSEQTIQAEAVVKGLAQPTGLAIDLTLAELSYQEEDPKTVATNRLEDLAKALAAARKSGVAADVETAWNAVASFMASWDSKIQDHLAHRALVSAGYQLGRGLAEIRWAMIPGVHAENDAGSLRHLAGAARVAALERLVERLASVYDPVTRRALTASLEGWASIVTGAARVDDTLLEQLDRQALVWHDLVVGERTGGDLVEVGELIRKPALLWHASRELWPELTMGAVGIAVLSWGAWILASSQVAQHPPAAVATVLGIAGLTVSAISAWARSAAKGLGAGLREKVFADLAAQKAFLGAKWVGKRD